MTGEQKHKIHALREQRLGYAEIADAVGMSKNTVKTYCWRNNLSKNDASEETGNEENNAICKHCGKKLRQDAKNKPRKFCCDACRFAWWRENRRSLNRKAVYQLTCAHCGAVFGSYGNKNRKYCSHACYIKARFGEVDTP
jgi:endogenous inhibitor of DNA gyrase (YacG/DUF329 family)